MRLRLTILFLLFLTVGLHLNVAAKAVCNASFFCENTSVANNIYVDNGVSELPVVSSVSPATFQMFSHGRSGFLYLNHEWLDAKAIVSFIKKHHMLSSDIRHMNVYGCEFAKGEEGRKAVKYLESHLYISIAASENITGKNGDWILEVGQAIDVISLPEYNGNLQCGGLTGGLGNGDDFDGDGICNGADLDDDNDGILDSEEKPCLDCDKAYPFPVSRVIWQPFTGSPNTVYGTITKDGMMDSVTATTTKIFQSVDNTNYWGTGIGSYSGCPDGVSAFPNSALSSFTSNYTATFTFTKPVLNPTLIFSSFDQSPVNFPQSVYVIGKQGTIGSINIGNYITSMPGTENLYAVVYTGVYSQITFTVPGNDHNGSIILYFDKIMPAGTATYVDATYNACRDMDTDNDGIANRFDLDSDGDTCSDAFEGGATNNTGSNYQFTGTFGTNGFIDLKETVADNGIINYSSTYSLYSVNKLLSFCTDTDNDGIKDFMDIDADNDGVINVTECPSCYYQSKELITDIVTELQVNNNNGPYNAIDNNVSTISISDGATPVSWVGKALYRITTAFPVAINSMQLDRTTWPISTAAGNTFKLQGSSDNSTWTDLSAALNSTATTGTLTVTNTQPNNVYSYYRLVGVAGVNGYGGVTELRLVPNAYVSSLHPKATATLNAVADIDNDGIFNQLDLDSDGDACPDAIESGTYNQPGVTSVAGNLSNGSGGIVTNTISTPNALINGPYSGNGFADVLQSTTDSNAYKYNYTYNQYATRKFLSLCADFDNDGVKDLVDIDDDNDGVLDAIEAPDCYSTSAQANAILYVSSGLITNGDQSDGDLEELHDAAASTNIITAAQLLASANIYTVQFQSAVNLTSLSLAGTTANWGAGSSAQLQGSVDGNTWTDVTATQATTAGTTKTFTITLNAGDYFYYRIKGIAGTSVAITTTNISTVINTAHYVVSQHPKDSCLTDTDNDGLTNNLDLDSDGDNCPDAKESGVYNKNGVVAQTGTIKNGVNGVVTTITSGVGNALIAGPYSGNGFADVIQNNDTNTYKFIYTYNVAVNNADHTACNIVPNGTLSGSLICSGSPGALTFNATTGTGPFTLIINGVTYTNVLSGIPFNVSVAPAITTTYTLTNISDTNLNTNP
jgi:hypothetical protein